MADRAPGVRAPDSQSLLPGRPDTNLMSGHDLFGARSDIEDFFLAGRSGASLGTSVLADGATDVSFINTTPVVGSDGGAWVLSGTDSTVAIDSTVIDVAPTSVSVTPDGLAQTAVAFSEISTMLDGTTWLHLTGKVQYHRVSHDATITVQAVTYDSAGVLLTAADGGIGNIQSIRVTATNTDTWLPIDLYIQCPSGSAAVQLEVSTQARGALLAVTEITYLNNFSIARAAIFTGVHAGYVALDAAAQIERAYVETTVNVTNITALQTILTAAYATDVGRIIEIRGHGVLSQNVALGLVKVFIYDVNGNPVGTIFNGHLGAGTRMLFEASVRVVTTAIGYQSYTLRASASAGNVDIFASTAVAGDPGPAWLSMRDLGKKLNLDNT